MKTKLNLERIIKECANEEYCAYCIEPRMVVVSCCGENHFVLFSDLDTDSQHEIAAEIARKEG
jgi:hypothetical protein